MRLALAIALLLAGCGVPEKGGFDEVEREVQERVGARVHWYQGTPEDQEAESRVAELLSRELTADAAVQVALLNNRSLQAEYEDLGVAQAELVQAGLLENPVFFGHVGIPDEDSPVELGFELVADFLDLLLRPARMRLAEFEFEAARRRVSHRVLEVASETRIAFYRLQGELQVADVLRLVAQAERAGYEFAVAQREAGNLSELDLSLARIEYEETKVELARAEFEVLAEREHLNQLLGVWGPATAWTVSPRLPEVPAAEVPLEALEARAVERRLDLAAARLEAERLGEAVAAARDWRWLGRVEVGAELDREIDGAVVAGPTVELAIPIFDQGQARIARLEAELRRSRREAEALAIEIRSEVRETAYRLVLARRTAEHYRTVLVPLAERVVALTQRHYNFMLLGIYELLEVKRDEVRAWREYVEAVRDYWIARAELERAVGGSLPPADAQGGTP